MEGNIEEKRSLFISFIITVSFISFFLLPSLNYFLFMGLEELADQEFDASDVPPHLKDRAVLLCVGKLKRVYRSWTNMLLPNYTCINERVVKNKKKQGFVGV